MRGSAVINGRIENVTGVVIHNNKAGNGDGFSSKVDIFVIGFV
jgi:hypothetical protein